MDGALNLARYINSLSDLYPHGVLKPTKQKPIIIVDPKELKEQKDFLNSIIEKGMKFALTDVEITSDVDRDYSAKHAMAFGVSANGATLAPYLSEIASNPETKKKFWELLKGFLK